ncbi:MAG TPA: UvrB/UvrC motif-containing protein [Longimicrobiales bacterium]|nr:UvrB/UvrC motif-containing protein [Longimicrobiales bacterium]
MRSPSGGAGRLHLGRDMRCENCGEREAEIHLTQIEGDEMTTVHLCPACAADQGVGTPLPTEAAPLTDFLAQITESGSAESSLAGSRESCPYCGTSPGDFRKTGRLGCPQCYPHFESQLKSLLRRVHGAVQHVGKVYVSPGEAEDDTSVRLASLRRRLERAVEIEDFETAARLRDEIHALEVAG